jgi:TRAP-type C4-dicarboxylate transport system permease small subunit
MLAGKLKVASSMPFNMSPIYAIVPFSGIIMILNSIERIYYVIFDKFQGGNQ